MPNSCRRQSSPRGHHRPIDRAHGWQSGPTDEAREENPWVRRTWAYHAHGQLNANKSIARLLGGTTILR